MGFADILNSIKNSAASVAQTANKATSKPASGALQSIRESIEQVRPVVDRVAQQRQAEQQNAIAAAARQAAQNVNNAIQYNNAQQSFNNSMNNINNAIAEISGIVGQDNIDKANSFYQQEAAKNKIQDYWNANKQQEQPDVWSRFNDIANSDWDLAGQFTRNEIDKDIKNRADRQEALHNSTANVDFLGNANTYGAEAAPFINYSQALDTADDVSRKALQDEYADMASSVFDALTAPIGLVETGVGKMATQGAKTLAKEAKNTVKGAGKEIAERGIIAPEVQTVSKNNVLKNLSREVPYELEKEGLDYIEKAAGKEAADFLKGKKDVNINGFQPNWMKNLGDELTEIVSNDIPLNPMMLTEDAKQAGPFISIPGAVGAYTGLTGLLGAGLTGETVSDNIKSNKKSSRGRKIDQSYGQAYEWELPSNSDLVDWDGETWLNWDGSETKGTGNIPATEYNRRLLDKWQRENFQDWGENLSDTGNSYDTTGMSTGRRYQMENNYVLPAMERLLEYDQGIDQNNLGANYGVGDIDYDYHANAGFKDTREILNEWFENMNTKDYRDSLEGMSAADRRKLRAQNAFDTFGGEDLGNSTYDEMLGNYVRSMIRDMYDDNNNYLTNTRAAAKNLNQADRFYYYVGGTKGGQDWAGSYVDPETGEIVGRPAWGKEGGYTNYRVDSFDPTASDADRYSYGDAINRIWSDLFEEEMREALEQGNITQEEYDSLFNDRGHFRRNDQGDLERDIQTYANDYFTKNALALDEYLLPDDWHKVGVNYNSVLDFLNFVDDAVEDLPSYLGLIDINKNLFGNTEQYNKALAQYLTNALALDQAEGIDGSGRIGLDDINAGLKAVGDTIMIGKDSPYNTNHGRLNSNGGYYLNDTKGHSYIPYANENMAKIDQSDIDKILSKLGSDYGTIHRDEYDKWIDNMKQANKQDQLQGKTSNNPSYYDPYMGVLDLPENINPFTPYSLSPYTLDQTTRLEK